MNKKNRDQLFFYGILINSLIIISCVSKPAIQVYTNSFQCPRQAVKVAQPLPECGLSTEDDHYCQIKLENLKPTQFNYGGEYVKQNYNFFLHQPEKYQSYLCQSPIEIVVGSKKNPGFYVVDGHHRLKIIELFRNLQSTDFTIIAKVTKNYRLVSANLEAKDFWNSMIADNFVYLSNNGQPKTTEQLPTSFAEMTNDPYISLVSFIRDDKQKYCFNNELSSFQNYGELYWADYFRNYKGLELYTDKKIYNYYKNRIIYFPTKNPEKKKNICKSLEASHLPGYSNLNKSMPTLVIDSNGANGEVKHFRTMKMLEKVPHINKKGLKNLNASGSAQFSENQLAWVKMNTAENLTVVDLRQESHGFINGNPVTWTAPMNWANKGKLKNNILIDESVRLNELLFQDHIAIPTAKNYKKNNFKISDFIKLEIQNITREDEIAQKNNIGYYRITVSDHSKPTDDDVEDFYHFYKTLKAEQWVHFHCRGGKGRTTTFLAMYDMLHNAHLVSFQDIIKRQAAIEPFYNLQEMKKPRKKKLQEDRLMFLKDFYLFAKDVHAGFKGTWKQWKVSKSA